MSSTDLKVQSKVRLNLFIASHSAFSRRKADLLVKERKVRVNGHLVREIPCYIDPKKDVVKINGKILKPYSRLIYIAFNKPSKTLTTLEDPKNRPTVFHYLKKTPCPVFPVGRLDWSTEGLLLFTNDGSFAQKVMSPKSKIPKTYLVKLNRTCPKFKLEKLKKGVTIPTGRVRALFAEKKSGTWVRVTILEGKNRQIHYMFKKLGFMVNKMKRTSIGKLQLGSLKKGEGRYLNSKDIQKIFIH